ncbi:F0F1 ATP synthase subunit epsilon [Corynebacterium xerosis]|uniref:ATP synthase epsilon chain n=1 Tax=Corynebacterium xerosis TaxID=1725 RepID=A0A0M2XKM2_9CORY|nr:F0F1 ATP synthase subunit epsilon [Corynebacterium xerosis]SQB95769.1 ATP synthase F1 subunit epsilon [Clostridium paraputrificum]AYJ32705.1 F0F1 ATP synthase subunit epsilon [Corynebacterium xerosis]KKO80922.1 ATP synthase F0F1 subunit epsilon [Corynebacterium xerosis]NMF08524.1 F0F1 ATP synthase subunit epsilon [Corynebacterium xerosis]HJG57936.1 F0F1 ATP synthase subunit epsilon [Corynebacterium xerosis]
MADIATELVAVERKLWEGKATSVTAETTEGEIGVLPGHQPFLGQLTENGTVTIRTDDGQVMVAAVQGGFLSVSTKKITVLADKAVWADEVDVSDAEARLQSDDPEVKAKAESELRASRRAKGVA